jgi:flagellar biogenesis protein FliO
MLNLGTGLYALSMLALVLGLILGLGWLLRTYGTRLGLTGNAANKPTLKITQRLTLTAQHTLIEIESPTHTTQVILGPNHSTVVTREVLKTRKK